MTKGQYAIKTAYKLSGGVVGLEEGAWFSAHCAVVLELFELFKVMASKFSVALFLEPFRLRSMQVQQAI